MASFRKRTKPQASFTKEIRSENRVESYDQHNKASNVGYRWTIRTHGVKIGEVIIDQGGDNSGKGYRLDRQNLLLSEGGQSLRSVSG